MNTHRTFITMIFAVGLAAADQAWHPSRKTSGLRGAERLAAVTLPEHMGAHGWPTVAATTR